MVVWIGSGVIDDLGSGRQGMVGEFAVRQGTRVPLGEA
jgi:hypothetical protein